jgi:hypothetical protein
MSMRFVTNSSYTLCTQTQMLTFLLFCLHFQLIWPSKNSLLLFVFYFFRKPSYTKPLWAQFFIRAISLRSHKILGGRSAWTVDSMWRFGRKRYWCLRTDRPYRAIDLRFLSGFFRRNNSSFSWQIYPHWRWRSQWG